MQGDGGVNFLAAHDTLEVDVLVKRLVKVALYVTDQNFRIFHAFYFEVDDLRVEGVVFAEFDQIVLADGNGQRLGVTTVNDGRHPAFATQAAARTFALIIAALGVQRVKIVL